MNGVEAAASLFGPEESSSDPFSVLGAESAPSPIPENSNLFNGHGTSNFLDPISNKEHLGESDGYFSDPMSSNYQAFSDNLAEGVNAADHSQIFHGNMHIYQPDSYDGSVNNGGNSESKVVHEVPHGPYKPSISQNNTSSNIDHYAPKAPSATIPPQDYYNAYSVAPTAHDGYSTVPTTSDYSSAPVQPVPFSPAPATLSQTINRPKLLNAYDPPFPPISSRRSGRSNIYQTYGGYSAYHSNYSTAPAPVPSSTYTMPVKPPPQHSYPSLGYNIETNSSRPPAMDPQSTSDRPSDIGYRGVQPSLTVRQNSDHPSPTSPGSDAYAHPTRIPTSKAQSHHEPNKNSHHDEPYEPTLQQHTYSRVHVSQVPVDDAFHASEYPHSPPSSNLPNDSTEQSSFLEHPSQLELFAATHVYDRSGAFYSPSLDQAPDVSRLEDAHGLDMSSSYSFQKHTGNIDSDPYAPKSAVSSFVDGKRSDSPISSKAGDFMGKPYMAPYTSELGDGDASFSNGTVFTGSLYADPYTSSQPKLSTHYSQTTSHHQDPSRPTGHNYDPSLSTFSLPYAPSPSLVGSNDPLMRTTAKAPVISFGFGGRLVACFHGASTLNTGFDVALSSRNSTTINFHILNKLVPESALDVSSATYPGPLFSDPGTPVIGLVRSAASIQTKTKKAHVLKYLDDRIIEISQGLGYQGRIERQISEARLVLLKLLKIMVENDGQLLGSPQAEKAVRSILVPRLDGILSPRINAPITASGFSTSVTDTHGSNPELSPVAYSAGVTAEPPEIPISVSVLKPSSLNKIEELLMRGERRQAYIYALDERLWPHAMIIASSIDKDAWKEVVNDFIRHELLPKDDLNRGWAKASNNDSTSFASCREGLRVAYSLFSGQGASAIQEFIPTNLLSGRPQVPAGIVSQVLPKTPQFPVNVHTSPEPESLGKWRETVAMIISSPLNMEASTALTALGDHLLSFNFVEAAHACYLLSPQSSPLGGVGSPGARITMLGCRSPLIYPGFSKDSDPFILSEILEFALSLALVPKGQEPFAGLPHLQPYRLIRAMSIAELGDLQLANRYCEAISASLARNSPYFSSAFLDQLRGLSERIAGMSHTEKPGSWIGGKLSKPSLDTIGGWLEGRFTKLVTGDGDTALQSDRDLKADQHTFAGPFAHYSTISTTPSARSSPQPIPPTSGVLAAPQRTSSAMAISSPFHHHHPMDRASSATDYMRNKPGKEPSSVLTNSSYLLTTGIGLNTRSRTDEIIQLTDTLADKHSPDTADTPVQGSTWWNSNSASAQTPTASTFMKVDETVIQANSDGFISLMDTQSYAIQRQPPVKVNPEQTKIEDDEDDLGLGNRQKGQPTEKRGSISEVEPHPSNSEEQQTKPEATANGSGSWLSKWWKGDSSGPVKASLGEESAFYYDKDLKRWVNKKAGSDENKPAAPPPPPSRAQTASPSKSAPRIPVGSGPPLRSSSAMEFGPTSENGGLRVRSNLVPSSETAPSTPTGSRAPPTTQGPPPHGRPRSQATKRNIRSRYVDVFQQDNGGP